MRNNMSNQPIMLNCEMCGSLVQFGPHTYNGNQIAKYDLFVCRSCYDGNWDGWAPHLEKALEDHLISKGIPLPERNDKGWYPRGE